MPKVSGKKFPYTAKGKKDAADAKKGGKSGFMPFKKGAKK